MNLEQLVSQYGYLAILIGTFLEGETILLIGGFLAHARYLELPWVIVAAFVGTLSGDQLFFYIGRWKGPGAVAARPRWKARAERIAAILRRHQNWLILGFRFLYGLRSVSPFVFGASGIHPVRFLVLNIIGAGIWAVAFGVLGYALGQTVHALLADVKRYERLVVAVVIALVGMAWLLLRLRKMLGGNR